MDLDDYDKVNDTNWSNLNQLLTVVTFFTCGVTRMDDRVRNEVVRERVGVPEKLSGRVDRKVLKWFGHVERMGSERMTKRVYMSEVEEQRGRGMQ